MYLSRLTHAPFFRFEGGTDRQNDAAEWPPFFAASMLQIFLVQASGAQGVFSKASSAKDTMLFEIGKTPFSSNTEFTSSFVKTNPTF